MTRRVLFTNLITLSITAIGCDFIADFKKDEAELSLAGAAGGVNRGGASSTAGAAANTASGKTTGGGGTNPVTASSSGGSTSLVIGNGGTTDNGSGATTVANNSGIAGALTSSVGQGSSIGPTGGAAPLGGSANSQGTVATGGIAGGSNNGGSLAKGGESNTGGVLQQGGAAGNGGTSAVATGGAPVVTGGMPGIGGSATGGGATGGTTSNPCDSVHCLNGGSCVVVGGSPQCQCVNGYFGTNCETLHFEWLGIDGCTAYAVSSDGKVVAGAMRGVSTELPARWTKETGFQALQSKSDVIDQGASKAISSDGSVIVGWATLGSGGGAFRWTATEGVVSLGLGIMSRADGVSSNGAIIVGTTQGTETTPLVHLFRWSASGGAKDLVALGNSGSAAGVSGDGTAIAGGYTPVASDYLLAPFIWTQVPGLKRLGTEAGGNAKAISQDGTTVVGGLNGAFRYKNNVGFEYISVGSSTNTSATVVNADGNMVGGGSDQGAWLWDTTNGTRMFVDILSALGIDMTQWLSLGISGMTPDGKTVVGTGYRSASYTCWIARF